MLYPVTRDTDSKHYSLYLKTTPFVPLVGGIHCISHENDTEDGVVQWWCGVVVVWCSVVVKKRPVYNFIDINTKICYISL